MEKVVRVITRLAAVKALQAKGAYDKVVLSAVNGDDALKTVVMTTPLRRPAGA